MTRQDAQGFAQELREQWREKEIPDLAAALAFYSVFSLAPLVVLAVAFAGALFGREAAEGRLVTTMSQTVGPQGAEAIQGVLANAELSGGGGLATFLSVALLLFGASAVFSHLKRALNRLWDVREMDRSLAATLMNRVLGMGAVLVTGLLLVGLIAFNATVSAFATQLGLTGSPIVYRAISYVGLFVLAFAAVAAIFKYLPDVNLSWRSVLPGALGTAVLLGVVALLFGVYLSNTSTVSVYGAAGSIVAVLLWIYASSLALFVGAELTQMYARRRGDGMERGTARPGSITPHPEVPESWQGRTPPRR